MLYESTSVNPVRSDRDLTTEHLKGGAHIVRNRLGEVVQTADALGIRRDFGHEAVTRKLLVRKLGVWTKLDGGCLDAAGTLFYRKGELEIQERLNGVHIHTNKQTGVMIQNDHVNHCEIIRQANGEVWKREVDETRELFEMWLNNRLTFRTQTFFHATRCQAKTPNGIQALIYVATLEQSWETGLLTREKYTFLNPLTNERDVDLTVSVDGELTTVRNVEAVVTTFVNCRVDETIYELKDGRQVQAERVDTGRQPVDTEGVQQFAPDDEPQIGFGTMPGAGAVFSTY